MFKWNVRRRAVLCCLIAILGFLISHPGNSAPTEAPALGQRLVKVHELLETAVELRDLGETDLSEQVLKEAERLLPDYLPTLILSAKHAFKMNKAASGFEYLERASAAVNRGGNAEGEHRLALAAAYIEADRVDDAKRQLSRALTFGRQKRQPLIVARSYIALGAIETTAGQLESAEGHLEAAGKVLSTSPHTLDGIETRRLWMWQAAEFYERQGSFGKAVSALESLAGLSVGRQDRADITFRLGRIRLAMGDFVASERYFLHAHSEYADMFGEDHVKTKAAQQGLFSARQATVGPNPEE